MDPQGFVRRLEVPAGFRAPERLAHDDLVATPLTREDLDDDVAGINSSVELIQRTRGGGWPTGPVTREDNYVDLVWHEREHREGTSFAYVVRDLEGAYLGCAYLYPMGLRTELAAELLDHDVDVSWWVTAQAHDRGCYEKLHGALVRWLADDFPFARPYYSNREVPA